MILNDIEIEYWQGQLIIDIANWKSSDIWRCFEICDLQCNNDYPLEAVIK